MLRNLFLVISVIRLECLNESMHAKCKNNDDNRGCVASSWVDGWSKTPWSSCLVLKQFAFLLSSHRLLNKPRASLFIPSFHCLPASKFNLRSLRLIRPTPISSCYIRDAVPNVFDASNAESQLYL